MIARRGGRSRQSSLSCGLIVSMLGHGIHYHLFIRRHAKVVVMCKEALLLGTAVFELVSDSNWHL